MTTTQIGQATQVKPLEALRHHEVQVTHLGMHFRGSLPGLPELRCTLRPDPEAADGWAAEWAKVAFNFDADPARVAAALPVMVALTAEARQQGYGRYLISRD